MENLEYLMNITLVLVNGVNDETDLEMTVGLVIPSQDSR